MCITFCISPVSCQLQVSRLGFKGTAWLGYHQITPKLRVQKTSAPISVAPLKDCDLQITFRDRQRQCHEESLGQEQALCLGLPPKDEERGAATETESAGEDMPHSPVLGIKVLNGKGEDGIATAVPRTAPVCPPEPTHGWEWAQDPDFWLQVPMEQCWGMSCQGSLQIPVLQALWLPPGSRD